MARRAAVRALAAAKSNNRSKHVFPPSGKAFVARMNECMKQRSLACALEVYEEANSAVSEPLESLPAQAFHVLLQLSAGMDSSGVVDRSTLEAIRNDMKCAGLYPDEPSVTAVARARARCEGGDAALHACVVDKPENQRLKLRTYSPAVTAFCEERKPLRALQAETYARADGVRLSDFEYAALLRALAEGCYIDEGFALLERLSGDLRLVDSDVLHEPLERFFNACGPRWHVALTHVHEDGVCDANPEIAAQPFDVSNEQAEDMLEALRQFAYSRSCKLEHFDRYTGYVRAAQPQVMVDGSNIGLFNQNFVEGGFSFAQIARVVAELEREVGHRTQPVVCLHSSRLRSDEAQDDDSKHIIECLEKKSALCVAPKGANDDWYWLYAAIAAGSQGIAVTNDELRDHIAHMMPDPNAFLRWQELHQAHFSMSSNEMRIVWPEPFTTTVQHRIADNDCNSHSWWLFPLAEHGKRSMEPQQGSARGTQRWWIAAWQSPQPGTSNSCGSGRRRRR